MDEYFLKDPDIAIFLAYLSLYLYKNPSKKKFDIVFLDRDDVPYFNFKDYSTIVFIDDFLNNFNEEYISKLSKLYDSVFVIKDDEILIKLDIEGLRRFRTNHFKKNGDVNLMKELFEKIPINRKDPDDQLALFETLDFAIKGRFSYSNLDMLNRSEIKEVKKVLEAIASSDIFITDSLRIKFAPEGFKEIKVIGYEERMMPINTDSATQVETISKILMLNKIKYQALIKYLERQAKPELFNFPDLQLKKAEDNDKKLKLGFNEPYQYKEIQLIEMKHKNTFEFLMRLGVFHRLNFKSYNVWVEDIFVNRKSLEVEVMKDVANYYYSTLLQEISNNFVSENRKLWRDKGGSFHYNNVILTMNKKTIYFKLLDALFSACNKDGFCEYQKIIQEAEAKGFKKAESIDKQIKQINNHLVNPQNGFHRFLNSKHEIKEKLITTVRTEGLQVLKD